MSLINIKIEGVPYQVESGLTILEACKKCGYEIPSLCTFNHGECNQGSCRVCLVEATGARGLVASCVYPVNEGMEITISSPKAVNARRGADFQCFLGSSPGIGGRKFEGADDLRMTKHEKVS